MAAAGRIGEAREGAGYVGQEIDGWVAATNRRGPPGAHLSRLATLQQIMQPTLDAIAGTLSPEATGPLDLPGAYALARATDKRVLFCRRLFRWYAMRFDQRADPGLDRCLAGADEVVWSVWARTFAAAKVPRRPAPLCFVDNDPIPWASRHNRLPIEARPPSGDDFLSARIKDLPLPVVGLPPVVAWRPWWLVAAIHETGHHLQYTLATGLVDEVAAALGAAATEAGAEAAEGKQWQAWGAELFADAYAAVFAGQASVWVISELERAFPDPLAARPTYPPAEVRLRLAAALVAETGAPAPDFTLAEGGVPADLTSVRELLDRVPAIVTALLDHPIGATSLRELGGDGRARSEDQALWAEDLRKGQAVAVQTLDAAAACVGGAVRAWLTMDGTESDAAALREQVLTVLPGCRPDGDRAADTADDLTVSADGLLAALLDPGAPL
jgi:hypothetical protein